MNNRNRKLNRREVDLRRKFKKNATINILGDEREDTATIEQREIIRKRTKTKEHIPRTKTSALES